MGGSRRLAILSGLGQLVSSQQALSQEEGSVSYLGYRFLIQKAQVQGSVKLEQEMELGPRCREWPTRVIEAGVKASVV